MKILGISHIGIASKDPQKTRWFFEEILGLPFEGEELVIPQKTNTIMFGSSQFQGGAAQARLEILENQRMRTAPSRNLSKRKVPVFTT